VRFVAKGRLPGIHNIVALDAASFSAIFTSELRWIKFTARLWRESGKAETQLAHGHSFTCNVGFHLSALASHIVNRPIAVRACNQRMRQQQRIDHFVITRFR
jgi:hypothetical protein